jgi:putative CocE/NonD family hydrolase
MFGSSQTGISQLGVASFHPRGLDAITPFHIATDYYRDVAYPGGVFNSKFMKFYAAYLVTIDKQTAAPAIKSGDQQCLKDFRAHVRANPRYSIGRIAPLNPFDDAYWLTAPESALNRIDMPILGCQSWQDGIVSSRATELYYDTFKPSRTWFIGTNGPHGICEFTQPLTMMVNFLRHYVAGANNGWQRTPRITNQHELTSTNTSPPVPGWVSTYNNWSQLTKPVALYLRGSGSLAASPVTSAAAAQSSFAGPSASQSGRWTKAPVPGTSVSYTTPPLASDADFFGPGSVNLWVSSTAADSDIEVIISEVRPDGTEQFVQASWLNLAERKLAPAGDGPLRSSVLRPFQLHTATSYQPLRPGQPVYARVELFPFEHVFRAGSSIRITIDSADGNVETTGYWGVTSSAGHFTDTVYASAARPSKLVLGLIPGATIKRPLPSCANIAGEPCRPNPTPAASVV